MMIYEMTATFGKLEHQTLTLRPGLNVIQAPNEWGKSTWCAFLISMLYGMETRSKTTKTVLAEKEKYAPWSGSPMEGRIDLNWNGRDITIERRTKGRTPLGAFRAYETVTGLEVPELTAANCGQTLLGVERSVFARAGFLRLADLPVTQDEALRRRLNALVTTGDESGAADVLSGKLRELKNSIRYNRSGKLPAAEAELAELEEKRQELEQLRRFEEDCRRCQAEEETRLLQLRNHQVALAYEAAREDARLVQAADEFRNAAAQRLRELEETCAGLPARETVEADLSEAQNLQRQMMALQMESQLLPQPPVLPEPPESFQGVPVDQAETKAAADAGEYERLRQVMKKKSVLPWVLIAFSAAMGIGLGAVKLWLGIGVAVVLAVAGLVLLMTDGRRRQSADQEAKRLAAHYHSPDAGQWVQMAESYVNQRNHYEKQLQQSRAARIAWNQRYEQLRLQLQNLTQGEDLQIWMEQRQQMLSALETWEKARRDSAQAEEHFRTLQAMAKSAPAPEQPDVLTLTETQTARLMEASTARLRQLQTQRDQSLGRMEAIGDEKLLHTRIHGLKRRIEKLEEIYGALEIAQRTLTDAAAELQRRFAPRIAARAQALFGRLTGGRYNRLSLTQELAVHAGAAGEDTLRSAQWRSDGTADQMYLALRLAVAEELTPDAPLVLDDVLVRFDDQRLQWAMEVLRQTGESRQVLLFTCQGRESRCASADYAEKVDIF